MSRTSLDAELIIIGAGAAGLSLAARLARSPNAPRTLLVEPRTAYEDDRSWCFWAAEEDDLSHLVSARWPRWRFSTEDGEAAGHEGTAYTYRYIRSLDFYRDALKTISANPAIRLLDGMRAEAVKEASGEVRVSAGNSILRAPYAIDTRPGGAMQPGAAPLFQCFAGAEIAAGIDTDSAELMGAMRADEDGFAFAYALPLGPQRALLEATRFSPHPLTAGRMHRDLETLLDRRGLSGARRLRSETGTLPMGLTPASTPRESRIVRAGLGGGALRAATGYGFQRIQSWARRCAEELLAGRAPCPHAGDPPLRAAMDRLFIDVLRREPERGPALFLAMARRLPADGFARFMSDAARPGDLARLVTGLAPAPFLRALLTRPVRPEMRKWT